MRHTTMPTLRSVFLFCFVTDSTVWHSGCCILGITRFTIFYSSLHCTQDRYGVGLHFAHRLMVFSSREEDGSAIAGATAFLYPSYLERSPLVHVKSTLDLAVSTVFSASWILSSTFFCFLDDELFPFEPPPPLYSSWLVINGSTSTTDSFLGAEQRPFLTLSLSYDSNTRIGNGRMD